MFSKVVLMFAIGLAVISYVRVEDTTRSGGFFDRIKSGFGDFADNAKKTSDSFKSSFESTIGGLREQAKSQLNKMCDNFENVVQRLKSQEKAMTDQIETSFENLQTQSGDTLDKTLNTIQANRQTFESKVNEIIETLTKIVAQMEQKARDLFNSVRGRAGQEADDMRAQAQNFMNKAREGRNQMMDRLSEFANKRENELKSFVNQMRKGNNEMQTKVTEQLKQTIDLLKNTIRKEQQLITDNMSVMNAELNELNTQLGDASQELRASLETQIKELKKQIKITAEEGRQRLTLIGQSLSTEADMLREAAGKASGDMKAKLEQQALALDREVKEIEKSLNNITV